MTKRKKYEEIAEHLELSIVSGRLREGERIPSERDLMETFDVGRSSVREALFSLQRKGLLSKSPGAVAHVRLPTADLMVDELSGVARLLMTRTEGVREMQEARALFEIGLARRAAKVASETAIASIGDALAANEAASDGASFIMTDVAFHTAIAEACANQIYVAVSTAFFEWLHEQRAVSARAGATREEAIAQHRRIFEAIAARDHIAAEDAMEDHLATVARYYQHGVSATSLERRSEDV